MLITNRREGYSSLLSFDVREWKEKMHSAFTVPSVLTKLLPGRAKSLRCNFAFQAF